MGQLVNLSIQYLTPFSDVTFVIDTATEKVRNKISAQLLIQGDTK